jgi:hypothetical protein
MSHLTRILSAIEQGDAGAAEQLLPLTDEELRKLAEEDSVQAELVKPRCTAGPSHQGVAEAPGISRATAGRLSKGVYPWIGRGIGFCSFSR